MSRELEKCRLCRHYISTSRNKGADGTDDQDNALPFWSDDPLFTPMGLAGLDYKGQTPLRPVHIIELQNYYRELEETYIEDEDDRTTFLRVVKSEPGRRCHIEQLRIVVEKLLDILGRNLEEYFKYDYLGEDTKLTQADWTDVDRSEGRPALPKGTPVRAIHIEELRRGIYGLFLEQWIITVGHLPFEFIEQTNEDTYGQDGGWQEGKFKTYTVTGDIGDWTIKAFFEQSNHGIFKKFGYPGEKGYVEFDLEYTPVEAPNKKDSILEICTRGYYNQTAVNMAASPGIAMALSNESYFNPLFISCGWIGDGSTGYYIQGESLKIPLFTNSKFRMQSIASGTGTHVYNSAWGGPGYDGNRRGYIIVSMRLFFIKSAIDPEIGAGGKEFIDIFWTDDPTFPLSNEYWKRYYFSQLTMDGTISFDELPWSGYYDGEPYPYEPTKYKYVWEGITISVSAMRTALGSYTEGWVPSQSGTTPYFNFTINKLGIYT
jgi:hypothetical protein